MRYGCHSFWNPICRSFKCSHTHIQNNSQTRTRANYSVKAVVTQWFFN